PGLRHPGGGTSLEARARQAPDTHVRRDQQQPACQKRTPEDSRERMTEQTHIPPQQEVTPAQRIRNDWNMLVERISYKGIVSNIPYLAFVVLLGIIYISNSQRAVETQKE